MIHWRVLTRDDCPLCEEFLVEWQRLLADPTLPPLHGAVQSVDDDPRDQRRYGLKIPVLLCNGELMASGHLDPADLKRRLSQLGG